MALPCLHALLLLATPAFLVAEEVCEELGLLQHMRSPKVLSTAPLPHLRGMLIKYGISGGAERVDTMNRNQRRDTMFYLLGLSKGQADGALQYGISAGHLPAGCERLKFFNHPDVRDRLLHCLAGRPCYEGLVDEPKCARFYEGQKRLAPGFLILQNCLQGYPVKGLPQRLPNDRTLAAFAYMALLASKLGLMSKCEDFKSYYLDKGLCYGKKNFQDPKCPFDILLQVIKDQIEIEGPEGEDLDVGLEDLAKIARRVLEKDDGSRTGTIVSVDFDLQDGTLASAGDRFMEQFVINNTIGHSPLTQAITRSLAGTFKSSFTKTGGWSFTGSADFKVPVFGGSVGMSMSATRSHSFSNSTEMSQTITRSNTWTISVEGGRCQTGKIMWQSWKADVPYTMVLRNSVGHEVTVHGMWKGVLAGDSRVELDECEAVCMCTTPNSGSAGHNQYTCDDGTSGYCAGNEECYSTASFAKGDWGEGCRLLQAD